MDNARKKELVRSYKERKRQQGVFAVHCEVLDIRWVAASRNLDTQKNQIWFILRSGKHQNSRMQTAWNTHGEGSFRYEILEEVSDENALLIQSLLKDRENHWRGALGAEPVVG